LTSFTEEMSRRGLDPDTRLITARSQGADESVARALELQPGDRIVFLERVRRVGEQPLLLEQVHLPEARFPDLLQSDMQRGSLYEAMADRYGVRLVRARETIEPVLPTAREARLLQQDRRRPALLLELIAFDATGAPVEYCRALVRGDRAKYYVEARGPRYGFLGRDRHTPGERGRKACCPTCRMRTRQVSRHVRSRARRGLSRPSHSSYKQRPWESAVLVDLLVTGDKGGKWSRWYAAAIPRPSICTRST